LKGIKVGPIIGYRYPTHSYVIPHIGQEDARSDVFKWNRKHVFFTYGEN